MKSLYDKNLFLIDLKTKLPQNLRAFELLRKFPQDIQKASPSFTVINKMDSTIYTKYFDVMYIGDFMMSSNYIYQLGSPEAYLMGMYASTFFEYHGEKLKDKVSNIVLQKETKSNVFTTDIKDFNILYEQMIKRPECEVIFGWSKNHFNMIVALYLEANGTGQVSSIMEICTFIRRNKNITFPYNFIYTNSGIYTNFEEDSGIKEESAFRVASDILGKEINKPNKYIKYFISKSNQFSSIEKVQEEFILE